VLKYYHIKPGADNGEFNTSQDRANFDKWTGRNVELAPVVAKPVKKVA
jgi:phenol/toluene 2-monooxygenase (NADH) P3/A3